jgi:hypothetical protein
MSKQHYQIQISYQKYVDKWDPRAGAAGKPRFVDSQVFSTNRDHKPTLKDVADLIEDKFFLNFKNAVPRLPGLLPDPLYDGYFDLSRLEDDNGNADSKGQWLADYEIIIEINKLSPVKVGSFGFKNY